MSDSVEPFRQFVMGLLRDNGPDVTTVDTYRDPRQDGPLPLVRATLASGSAVHLRIVGTAPTDGKPDGSTYIFGEGG